MLSILKKYGKTLTSEQESNLVKIQNELEKSFWAEGAPEIVKEFTFHRLTHSKCVLDQILKIAKHVDYSLDADACYILSMAALLHDVGMSIDISKKSDVLKIATDKYKAPSEPAKLDISSVEVQTYIRNIHNALSAAYCDIILKDSDKGKKAIIDCCLYHRNIKLENKNLYSIKDIHANVRENQLLIALFRMGDELDIGLERISIGMQDDFARNDESESYWELNKREKITIGADNDVTLKIFINKKDSERSDIAKLMNEVINNFNRKNGPLFSLLCKLGLRISFNIHDSKVEEKEELDSKILKACAQSFVAFLRKQLTDTEYDQIIKNKIALYERNLEDGMEVLKNNATVFFDPNKKTYVFFMYKCLKILDSDRGYRGQVLCQKAQDNNLDSELYKKMNRLSLLSDKDPLGEIERRCIRFEAYSCKRNIDGNWGEYIKTKCEETANGLGFLRFFITFEKFVGDKKHDRKATLQYKVGDEIGVLYKYEIPLEYWGDFLRRTISCFYEDAQIDLIIHKEYEDKLQINECELLKGIKEGNEEKNAELPNVQSQKLEYSSTWLGKQGIIEWENKYNFADDKLICYSYKLPVETMRLSSFKDLYAFKLYWDAEKIFDIKDDTQSKGTGISSASIK